MVRFFALALVVLAVSFSRVIPHPANFSPVAAMALFAGAYISNRLLAVALTWAALLIGDLVIGLHATMFFVYLAMALTVFLGSWVSAKWNYKKLAGGILGSSVLFFVISNFGVWIESGIYSHTLAGLQNCYMMAVPFFDNTVLSTAIFATALFVGFRYFEKAFAADVTENLS